MKHTLSPRQVQIVRLMSRGKSDKEIAAAVKRAVGTIRAHIRIIFAKLGARNRAHAVWLCRR